MIFGLIGRVPLQLLRVGDIPLQLLIFEICYSYTSFNTLGPPIGYVSLCFFCMDCITSSASLYVASIALRCRRGGLKCRAAPAETPAARTTPCRCLPQATAVLAPELHGRRRQAPAVVANGLRRIIWSIYRPFLASFFYINLFRKFCSCI